MTKEELEREAEEWIKDYSGLIGGYKFVKFDYDSMQKSYLAGAEPREKQIQIDAEQIRALQKQKGELTDKVKELEVQIEKMKNWCNCKNYQQCLIELAEQGKGMKPSECCVNCKKWEIKEK